MLPIIFVVRIFFLFLWLSSFRFVEGLFFFPFSVIILWRAGFLERYCVNLVLSWNTLVSPSMVIGSLAGYRSLGAHLCSLSVCITSAQDLLAFIVSGEKSGVILIGLPLYLTWPFSLTAFNILSLFSAFVFWLLCDRRNFFSGPVYLEFCRLLVCSWACHSLGLGSFLL